MSAHKGVRQPHSTATVVVANDGAPWTLTGQELLELQDLRQIRLHSARYWIVEAKQP